MDNSMVVTVDGTGASQSKQRTYDYITFRGPTASAPFAIEKDLKEKEE